MAQSRNVYIPDPEQENRLAIQPGEIEQGTLDAPTAYDAGIIDIRSGGLDPNLWQGTSAPRAVELIQNAPVHTVDPLVKDMVNAVLLSSGIPPEGDGEALKRYNVAKLEAITASADISVLESQINRSGASVRTPVFQAELALRKGETAKACSLSDTITEGRADVFWSRLRTLCHLQREEFSAAELTTELLRNEGYKNDLYYDLVRVLSGVTKAMPVPESNADPINQTLYRMAATALNAARPGQAFDPKADPELRLSALLRFLDQFSITQIEQVFSDLAFNPNDLEGSSSFDLESALTNNSAQGVAQLFLLAKTRGNPQSAAPAFSALMKRMGDDKSRKRLTEIFAENIQSWPADIKAQTNLAYFARHSVRHKDVLGLQNLYAALPESQERDRIALAADALGNGFMVGQLGGDIDRRLTSEKNERAIRDAFLGLALGAQISETALNILPQSKIQSASKISEGDKAVLKANAKARHTAQFLLRLTPILESAYSETGELSTPDIAFIIEQLQIIGLKDFANRIAARDFLVPLE